MREYNHLSAWPIWLYIPGSNQPISFFSVSLCMSSSQPNSFFFPNTHIHTTNMDLKLAWRTHFHALLPYMCQEGSMYVRNLMHLIVSSLVPRSLGTKLPNSEVCLVTRVYSTVNIHEGSKCCLLAGSTLATVKPLCVQEATKTRSTPW